MLRELELEHEHTCELGPSGRPLPAGVTLSIEPALVTVRGGGSAPAAVVLTDQGPTAAQLMLNNACGLANVETELLDAHGERVDPGDLDTDRWIDRPPGRRLPGVPPGRQCIRARRALRRCEEAAGFLAELKARVLALQPLIGHARERTSWRELGP